MSKMGKVNRETIGSVGQWAAAGLSFAGIIIEVETGAPIGYIIITTGAVIFAVATKIKYWRNS